MVEMQARLVVVVKSNAEVEWLCFGVKANRTILTVAYYNYKQSSSYTAATP